MQKQPAEPETGNFWESPIEPVYHNIRKNLKDHPHADFLEVYIGLGAILFFLLLASMAPYIGADQDMETKKTQIEYVSNEILIKVKKDKKIKDNARPDDTGLASLDKINKEHGVKGFEKVAKASKKSKDSGHDVFRWYKVSLPWNSEIITEDLQNPQSIQSLLKLQGNGPQAVPNPMKLKVAFEKYKKDPNVEAVEFNYILRTFQDSSPSPSESPVATPSASPDTTPTPTPETSPSPSPSPSLPPSNVPNDPYYSSSGSWGQAYDDLWGLKTIQAEGAWQKTTGSNEVVVAVIDTGIDYNHPDIAQNIWTNPDEIPGNGIDDDGNGYVDDVYGWDFASFDNSPIDDNGHGTHVAGTVGAVGNNGIGIVGVNWNVKIMAVKFLNDSGSGSLDASVSSLIYAADNGARVFNNSWGASGTFQAISDAVNYATAKRIVVVAAAGNSNADASGFSPANEPNVITVSSSDHNDQKSDFSNFGSKIDVAAPGGDSSNSSPKHDYRNILSLRASGTDLYGGGEMVVGTNYYRARGTSMASPHVAGAVALFLSAHPDFTPEEVRQALRQGADDVTGAPWSFNLGYGRLNVARSLEKTLPPPVAKILSPRQSSVVGGSEVSVSGTISSRGLPLNWSLEVGVGQEPATWTNIAQGASEIVAGELGKVNLSQFASGPVTVRLFVHSQNGDSEDRLVFKFDKELVAGWPQPFGISMPFFATGHPVVTDINGDGKTEFIAVGTYNGTVYVWQNNGAMLPGWPAQLGSGFALAMAPVTGDLDGDGKPEVIVNILNFGGGSKLFVLKSDGSIMLGWPKSFGNNGSYNTPAIADINGDRKNEIIFRNCGLHVLRIDGSELPGWPVYVQGLGPTSFCTDYMNSPTVADLDNDGSLEVLVYWATLVPQGPTPGDFALKVFNKDGSLRWSAQVPPNPPSLGAMSPAVGDLDSDGKLEVVMQNMSVGLKTRYVYVFLSDGSAYPGFPKSETENFTSSPLVVADLDKDGRLEILLSGAPRFKVLDSNGNEVSRWQVPIAQDEVSPTIGDFDGDFRPEIFIGGALPPSLWPNPDQNFGLYVVKADKGIVWEREYGWAESSPIAGDFDRDDKLEIAGVMNDGTGSKFYLWELPQPIRRLGYVYWEQLGFDARHTREFIFKPLYGSGRDTDWDYWSDTQENLMGTDPNRACSATAGANDEPVDAWPPDFNDDRKVNIVDLLFFGDKMIKKVADDPSLKRYDFDANGTINIIDVQYMSPYMTKTCTP